MKGRSNFLKLKNHFVKASTKIFDLHLAPMDIAIFFYLVSLTEDFDPSVRWIANKMGVSKNTAARSIIHLREANVLVLIENNTMDQSARYKFNSPSQWRKI